MCLLRKFGPIKSKYIIDSRHDWKGHCAPPPAGAMRCKLQRSTEDALSFGPASWHLFAAGGSVPAMRRPIRRIERITAEE